MRGDRVGGYTLLCQRDTGHYLGRDFGHGHAGCLGDKWDGAAGAGIHFEDVDDWQEVRGQRSGIRWEAVDFFLTSSLWPLTSVRWFPANGKLHVHEADDVQLFGE